MCSPFLFVENYVEKICCSYSRDTIKPRNETKRKVLLMDNRRWVIALNKNTGRRMEFAMCDVNNVAFYQAKYTFNGYDVKVLTVDEVEKFADNEKQNGIM